MRRAYLALSAHQVMVSSDSELYGELALNLPFAVEPTQRRAWEYQIAHLKELALALPNAHFFLEFLIPRMGRRADLVIIQNGIVFVVEYKIGAHSFERSGLDQVFGYALDLSCFHETSHNVPIVPILVATNAANSDAFEIFTESWPAKPLRISPADLPSAVGRISSDQNFPRIDAYEWLRGRYRPTPTIVEAAQALYRGHDVEEITRHEAGAENLTRTFEYVAKAIESAKNTNKKIICFITGVPGSGKTLAGLNLATARQRAHSDEHAVFLSGNGPLVEVLREALSLDAVSRARESGIRASKNREDRKSEAFIQNIHHFRDDALATHGPPIEKVAIFDEAQRAWNVRQTSEFMSKKRGLSEFSMSEPEFLLSVMDRHLDWCAIICLVGEGQEINTGEAGIEEWLRAIERSFPHWQAHLPLEMEHRCRIGQQVLTPDLHLSTSIRSYRAEKLSDFVGHLIAGEVEACRSIRSDLDKYPLLITRDLQPARDWLRSKRRGNQRAGLLASSNANRLKPHGVFVKARVEPARWFLAPLGDVRSSDALEDAATEFEVQGLELDWACVCWDANYRLAKDRWMPFKFKGTRWEQVNDDSRGAYIANSYRVLLTRARQGLVVFVPYGDREDVTRKPEWYDEIYEFLLRCGFMPLISQGKLPQRPIDL